MNFQSGYFSITNPLEIVDRWFNPFCLHRDIDYRGKVLQIEWTRRAERQLAINKAPIYIELQLYFSCVIKKRVLFYENITEFADSLEMITVTDKIQMAYRAVQSDVCSAEEFAQNYPVKQELTSDNAKRMLPRELYIDFKKGNWSGEFSI